MKKIAAVLFAALAFAGAPAMAQSADPAVAAAARELFDSMNFRGVTAEAFTQMSRQMPAMMRSGAEQAIRADAKLSDAQRSAKLAELDGKIAAATEMMNKIFGDPAIVDAMIDEMVPLYARYYTVEDMKAMAAFYRTPTGRKTLTLMPKLMNESMQISQRIVQPRMQKAMQDLDKKK
jgi:hypothetical protein